MTGSYDSVRMLVYNSLEVCIYKDKVIIKAFAFRHYSALKRNVHYQECRCAVRLVLIELLVQPVKFLFCQLGCTHMAVTQIDDMILCAILTCYITIVVCRILVFILVDVLFTLYEVVVFFVIVDIVNPLCYPVFQVMT